MYGNIVNKGIKATGQTASVPNDDVARLMYYFKCVVSVINYSGIDKLTNYKNYIWVPGEKFSPQYISRFKNLEEEEII